MRTDMRARVAIVFVAALLLSISTAGLAGDRWDTRSLSSPATTSAGGPGVATVGELAGAVVMPALAGPRTSELRFVLIWVLPELMAVLLVRWALRRRRSVPSPGTRQLLRGAVSRRAPPLESAL
jgi:hypothetical protein